MTWILRRIYFGTLLEITWNSLQIENQLVFPHYLQNWGCLQQSYSTISILYQAPNTWISVELYSFMTWLLMKRLIFALISSIFWAKTAERTASRNCIPFCCLISKILKLKGIHPLEDEYPYPKLSPINIHTLNASIGHSQNRVKPESPAPHGGSHSSSHSYDEKLDNIIASIQDISTEMSGFASLMHSHHILCDTKFTSLQTQLDQIQRKLEESED